MNRATRNFALTTHVALSVGWIGAAGAYLVLAVAAAGTDDPLRLRAAWIGMEAIGWYLIVPLALGALLTGCIMSPGTQWGLFRHYWVLASLLLTLIATAVLLKHMPAVSAGARLAADPDLLDLAPLRSGLASELLHAGVGVLVLLMIAALNVFKPQGLTAYGRRRSRRPADTIPAARDTAPQRPVYDTATGTPRWVRVVAYHAVAVALVLLIVHFAGGGAALHR